MTQAAPAPAATESHPMPGPRAGQGWASLRQAYDLALAGALGAIFGYTFMSSRSRRNRSTFATPWRA